MLTVIGEALVDLVPNGPDARYRESPGGSPSMWPSRSHDSETEPPSWPASRTTASIGEGQVTYTFDTEGTADWQWTAAELRAVDPATRVLHFGSIAAWTPPGAERIAGLVRALAATGAVLISYDPNIRPAVIGPRERAVELVERNIRLAHLVKASREDVDWLYPGIESDRVAARWSELGPALVVVTDGADGATAHPRGAPPVRRPGRPVDVIDTIGAGDAFMAGLLTGFVRRRLDRSGRIGAISDGTLADILDEAILVSAITCERAGADPPRLDELSHALRAGA